MSEHPAAFLSYARFDDRYENGRLTAFAERLAGEVRIQTGEPFHIFQDRTGIAWGEQWQRRIDESLDSVTFLIPIVTPGLLKSPHCRAELERFLERERRMNRGDLILPVYYVTCPVLDDPAKGQADPLAAVLAARQFADWRDLRFEPLTGPEIGRKLAAMAGQILAALDRGHVQRPAARAAAVGAPAASRPAAVSSRPVAKTDPFTRVVDPQNPDACSSLTAALAGANPGDRILVRPGLYREGIVMDKPIEIIGTGEPGEVVIEASGADVVLFAASMGRIANLTLRQTGTDAYFGVDITQGRLEMEECDIISRSLSCVAIHGGADPRLRRNRIHDGAQAGVLVYDGGQGTLEDNEISGHAHAGVEIKTGANPALRRNRIHHGQTGGVFVQEHGLGILEDNEICAHPLANVEIRTGGNPVLRRNRIHDGQQAGVFVHSNGLGLLEDNEIVANGSAGVRIATGANPTLRRNRINHNARQGVRISDHGRGTVEDNDLRSNAQGPWAIGAGCAAGMKGNLE